MKRTLFALMVILLLMTSAIQVEPDCNDLIEQNEALQLRLINAELNLKISQRNHALLVEIMQDKGAIVNCDSIIPLPRP